MDQSALGPELQDKEYHQGEKNGNTQTDTRGHGWFLDEFTREDELHNLADQAIGPLRNQNNKKEQQEILSQESERSI
jgi:hypothetical protein